jgi:hypothetical protein
MPQVDIVVANIDCVAHALLLLHLPSRPCTSTHSCTAYKQTLRAGVPWSSYSLTHIGIVISYVNPGTNQLHFLHTKLLSLRAHLHLLRATLPSQKHRQQYQVSPSTNCSSHISPVCTTSLTTMVSTTMVWTQKPLSSGHINLHFSPHNELYRHNYRSLPHDQHPVLSIRVRASRLPTDLITSLIISRQDTRPQQSQSRNIPCHSSSSSFSSWVSSTPTTSLRSLSPSLQPGPKFGTCSGPQTSTPCSKPLPRIHPMCWTSITLLAITSLLRCDQPTLPNAT